MNWLVMKGIGQGRTRAPSNHAACSGDSFS
jgi:hypothetical protein